MTFGVVTLVTIVHNHSTTGLITKKWYIRLEREGKEKKAGEEIRNNRNPPLMSQADSLTDAY